MYLYALDAILVSCVSESFECISSLNQVIPLISWNQRFISLTQGKHHEQQRNLTDGNTFQNLGGNFAGDFFLLDMLILLKLEFVSSCEVFCGVYSGDASSSLQSFIMLSQFQSFCIRNWAFWVIINSHASVLENLAANCSWWDLCHFRFPVWFASVKGLFQAVGLRTRVGAISAAMSCSDSVSSSICLEPNTSTSTAV